MEEVLETSTIFQNVASFYENRFHLGKLATLGSYGVLCREVSNGESQLVYSAAQLLVIVEPKGNSN